MTTMQKRVIPNNTIELETVKMGIVNLRILNEVLGGTAINIHRVNGKPNLYDADGGMRYTAGELGEVLKMVIECEFGEVTYLNKYRY